MCGEQEFLLNGNCPSLYAYLDEAGTLPEGPGYFVVAILVTSHPRPLQKVIRQARRKMKKSAQKRRRRLPELKFHNASDVTRRRVLETLSGKEVEIFVLAAELESGVQDTPENYAQAVWEILKECLAEHSALSLTVDIHFNAAQKRKAFDEEIERLAGQPVAITHEDSQRNNILQLADFVAGATYQKYNRGDSTYADIVARRVVTERVIKWPQQRKKTENPEGVLTRP